MLCFHITHTYTQTHTHAHTRREREKEKERKREKERTCKLSEVSYKGTNPEGLALMISSKPSYLTEAPSPNTITLEGRASTQNLSRGCEDSSVQSIPPKPSPTWICRIASPFPPCGVTGPTPSSDRLESSEWFCLQRAEWRLSNLLKLRLWLWLSLNCLRDHFFLSLKNSAGSQSNKQTSPSCLTQEVSKPSFFLSHLHPLQFKLAEFLLT